MCADILAPRMENPSKGSGIKRKIESGVYTLKVGTRVIREDKKPNFTDSEVANLRLEEERKGNLVQPSELAEAISYAKERFMSVFGGSVSDDLPIFKPERQFVFKKTPKGKELHSFKDRIRGIEAINTSEEVKQGNVKTRHPDILGTHFRGITMVDEIDENKLGEAMGKIRSSLTEQGFDPDVASEKKVRSLIYSRVLVHEWIHGIDKYFGQPFHILTLAEPIAYWFEQNAMMNNVSPEQCALQASIYESYFGYTKEGTQQVRETSWLFDEVGGANRIKQIMTTGKVSLKEMYFFTKLSMRMSELKDKNNRGQINR